jgi:SecD/SecF fusion protein
VKFLWGKLTIKGAKDKDVEAVELYAIKEKREPAMSGGVVTAKDTFDQSGKPAVSMQMNGQGARLGRINRQSIHSKK